MAKAMKVGRPELVLLDSLNHKNLVREVVSRGMPFKDVIESSDLTKGNWLIRNFYTTSKKPNLIDDFDEWRHFKMQEKPGNTPKKAPYLFDPRLNYGYVEERDSKTGEVTKEKKIRGFSKKLVLKRKEKDKAFGIFKGTKKSLTFECAARAMPIAETIKIVTEHFPEALEKSIKIWYSRAAKETKRLTSMRPGVVEEWKKPLELPKKLKLKVIEKPAKKLILKPKSVKLVLKKRK